jgi:predicted nucleic acid-binding protein
VIVLDTTILTYAVGDEHPMREPCRTLLRQAGRGRVDATTTVEVIQEFVHVRARRRGRADAAALGRDYATLFAPLLAPTAEVLVDGMRIYEVTHALGAFDAVLAAAAIANGATLVSADRAFAEVAGLEHALPDEAAAGLAG